MVAWRFAIRVHALVLDHEVDDFNAGPLLLIPSAPKQTFMSVEAFAGSLGGEQMLTEVEPASAALRSASAFFASGLLPLARGLGQPRAGHEVRC
jgi:hypothetical protein